MSARDWIDVAIIAGVAIWLIVHEICTYRVKMAMIARGKDPGKEL